MLSLMWLLGACTQQPQPLQQGELRLQVAFSNNLDGETEPCG